MSKIRRSPVIRSCELGVEYVLTEKYTVISTNSVRCITAQGQKVDTGLKAIGWSQYSFSIKQDMAVTVDARVVDTRAMTKLKHYDLAGIEVLFKIAYFPARRHKKRRIAKKWAKKYGYIERCFNARSPMGEIRLVQDDDWPIKLDQMERGLIITPKPEHKVEIDMRKVELWSEDKHITWDELRAKKERKEQW